MGRAGSAAGHPPCREQKKGAHGETSSPPCLTTTSCARKQQLAVGRQLDLVGRRAHETGLHSLSFLEHRQVLLELPFSELYPVLVPLCSLQLDVAVEDVRAERFANELRACKRVYGLPER